VGLNGATQFLQLHFKKQAVEIAVPLKEIPPRLGTWVQVSKDEPLESDIEAALATKEYIFRDYVNATVAGPEIMKAFDQKVTDKVTKELRPLNTLERRTAVMNLAKSKPDAVVNLAVTYYTGMVDTVAHIPDRCYVADGFVPSEYTTENWKTGEHSTEVRFMTFDDQAGDGVTVPRVVAYFFRVNDTYKSDPLGVRYRLQDLREKYGFYAKVELMMTTRDRTKAASVMTEFLKVALPEIEKCYPDWNKVNARPTAAAAAVPSK